MSLALIALALLTALACAAAAGLALALRGRGRWRLAGVLLATEALLLLALQVLLASVPLLGLEPSIAVPIGPLLLQAASTLLAVGGGAALVWLAWRGLGRLATSRRRLAVGLALAGVPTLALAGLAGLWQLSTPARVRERDPGQRTISLPDGFTSTVFLRGTIDNPTSLAFGPAGQLFVGDIGGSIWVTRDPDGDGVAEPAARLVAGFSFLTGLAWHEGELYVASQGKVEALRDPDDDGTYDARRTVVDGLPSMVYIPHTNNALSFGPDGRLYFGVGSTGGGDAEANPLAAAILSVNPDGSDLQVFARGLSNSFDVAFNAAGDMFAGDNQPGDTAAPATS
jgi:glucose/arabinose dehydrogenase